jgi:hypothetical protein
VFAVIPLTTPEELTDATEEALLLHEPPEPDVDNVIAELIHTEVAPAIVPAFGEALTVIVFVAVGEPHAPNTIYDIVAVPAATPVTTPEPSTVATDEVLLNHEPPETASVSEIVEDVHTDDAPVTVPASGSALTVTSCVSNAVPQLVVAL